MGINNFSSYFELIGSLCIGFVGITYLRDEIKRIIEKAYNKISTALVTERIERLIQTSNQSQETIDALKLFQKIYDHKKKKINRQEAVTRSFVEYFKNIALISFLFCFSAILIGGFQANSVNAIGEENSNNPLHFYFLALLALGCSIHSMTFFFKSFKFKNIKRPNVILFRLFIYFLIYTIISYIISYFRIEISQFIYFSIKKILSIITDHDLSIFLNFTKMIVIKIINFLSILFILIVPSLFFISLLIRSELYKIHYQNKFNALDQEHTGIISDIERGELAKDTILTYSYDDNRDN